MRPIDLVVIHCSATPPFMNIGVPEIREWHLDRGFKDIGYHYVLRRDGKLEAGRAEDQTGAHVKGHNANSLGICLVGGTNADDRAKAEFNYTMPQMIWLADLLNRLSEKWPAAQICGHRDIDANKSCPCFNVQAWWGGETLRKQGP